MLYMVQIMTWLIDKHLLNESSTYSYVHLCFSCVAGGPMVQSGQQWGAYQHHCTFVGQQPSHPRDVPFLLQTLCFTSTVPHCGWQADSYSTSNPQTQCSMFSLISRNLDRVIIFTWKTLWSKVHCSPDSIHNA